MASTMPKYQHPTEDKRARLRGHERRESMMCQTAPYIFHGGEQNVAGRMRFNPTCCGLAD